MIEFSPESQALAKAALADENPTAEKVLLSLDEMREAEDLAGGTLVIYAWLRRLPLEKIIDTAVLLKNDPRIRPTLDWLHAELLGGNKQSISLTEAAAKAAAVWLDALD